MCLAVQEVYFISLIYKDNKNWPWKKLEIFLKYEKDVFLIRAINNDLHFADIVILQCPTLIIFFTLNMSRRTNFKEVFLKLIGKASSVCASACLIVLQ